MRTLEELLRWIEGDLKYLHGAVQTLRQHSSMACSHRVGSIRDNLK